MKAFLILIFFATPHVSFSNSALRLENDSIKIVLSMSKHSVVKDSDLFIFISITSNRKRILQIPKGDVMDYIERGSGFYLIQCQKKIGSKYIDVPGVAHMDNPPFFDADTLYANDTKKFEIPIRLLYRYTKGQYRIRILAALSQLNKTPDVYSNWLYFNCSTDIKIE
jgi:hypothetical protein